MSLWQLQKDLEFCCSKILARREKQSQQPRHLRWSALFAGVNADYISRAIASNSRIQWVIIDKHAAQGRMCLTASMRFQETQSLSTRPAAMAYSKFSRSAASWAAVSPPAQTSKAQSAKKLAFCSTSFRESTNFDESPAALARAQCFWQTARAAVSSGPSQRERNSHPSAPAITENHVGGHSFTLVGMVGLFIVYSSFPESSTCSIDVFIPHQKYKNITKNPS